MVAGERGRPAQSNSGVDSMMSSLRTRNAYLPIVSRIRTLEEIVEQKDLSNRDCRTQSRGRDTRPPSLPWRSDGVIGRVLFDRAKAG
jgi:hypothetical protein